MPNTAMDSVEVEGKQQHKVDAGESIGPVSASLSDYALSAPCSIPTSQLGPSELSTSMASQLQSNQAARWNCRTCSSALTANHKRKFAETPMASAADCSVNGESSTVSKVLSERKLRLRFVLHQSNHDTGYLYSSHSYYGATSRMALSYWA